MKYDKLALFAGGELISVLLIADPIREDAVRVVRQLHSLGVDKICMMTKDSGRTAASVAAKVGVDEYHYELLPEDKADFIRREHEAGRKVIMVGDGINDTPALSEADVGVAINSGASIAKQIADITISEDDLSGLVYTKRLSDALMKRIDDPYGPEEHDAAVERLERYYKIRPGDHHGSPGLFIFLISFILGSSKGPFSRAV